MLRRIALGTAVLFVGSLSVFAAPKDDVQAAAKKLGDTSYGWKQTTESAAPQGGQGGGRRGGGFGGGPSEGRVEKGGFTHISMQRGDNTIEAYVKDGKGAIKTQDGWQSLAEATADGGDGQPNMARFVARTIQNVQTPDKQAAELATKAKDLKEEGGAIVGELTAEGAKELMSFRGGRGGNANFQAPEIMNPKGTVKFWVKDGNLAKYEYNVQGSMSFNNNDFNINRTTTVEIKDVGTTKVEVPEDAKKKIS